MVEFIFSPKDFEFEKKEIAFDMGSLAVMKGDKGDPFTYDDFTEEQLEALRGPKGDSPTEEEIEAIIDKKLESMPGVSDFTVDDTLIFSNGVLSVNTADVAEQDNTLPITSSAVNTIVGNIDILLKLI